MRWPCVDLKRVLSERFGVDLSEVSLGARAQEARLLAQQPVMPDIVKVGPQVNVESTRLPLDYCFS